jgi:hypothetical protein
VRDERARIQRGEDRGHPQHGGQAGGHERPAVAVAPREHDGEDERGDPQRGGEDGREDVLLVAIDGDGDGPREHRADDERDGNAQASRRGGRPRAEVAAGAQREEGRSVQREERHGCHPGQHGVDAEEVQDVAGVVAVGVQRHPVHEVRERDAPHERCADAAHGVGPSPRRPPARVVALLAPFEGDDADDEEDEDEEQREVEGREHRRVPRRERRERRAGGDDEPDLVAVPDGTDGLEHRAALALVARQEGQQDADAEVEALEEEVAAPEDRDQAEPEDLEAHQ